MRTNRNFLAAIVFAVCQTMAVGTVSWAQHSDVFVTNVAGTATIGGANDLGTVDEHFDLTTHVFEGVMIPDFPPFDPADYGRDEPGFHAEPASSLAFPVGASALPGSAAVTVNLPSFTVAGNTDTLFYWDGSGAADFQPISPAQPGVSLVFDPNPIGSTGAGGGLETHPVFELDNGGAGVPADGVYLIGPTVSVAGLTDSQPFYMVWLVDALLVDEDAAEELEEALEMGQFVVHGKDFEFFEIAVDYVHENLANVPEPSTALLSAMAMVGLLGLNAGRRENQEVPL